MSSGWKVCPERGVREGRRWKTNEVSCGNDVSNLCDRL
jgi:hypothetical protein